MVHFEGKAVILSIVLFDGSQIALPYPKSPALLFLCIKQFLVLPLPLLPLSVDT